MNESQVPDAASQCWLDGRVRATPREIHRDDRGTLMPFDFAGLPFAPRRVFAVADVPVGAARGGHAHQTAQQLLFCLHGRVDVLMRCEDDEAHTTLVAHGPGLLVSPGIWCRQTYLDASSVLLVMSSEPYDPASYCESWNWA